MSDWQAEARAMHGLAPLADDWAAKRTNDMERSASGLPPDASDPEQIATARRAQRIEERGIAAPSAR